MRSQIKRIDMSQHLDYLNSPGIRGLFFYTSTDKVTTETTFVGIRRLDASGESRAFTNHTSCFDWLQLGIVGPDEVTSPIIKALATDKDLGGQVSVLLGRAEATGEFLPIGAPIPYTAGTVGLDFDDNDPMAVMAAAQVESPVAQTLCDGCFKTPCECLPDDAGQFVSHHDPVPTMNDLPPVSDTGDTEEPWTPEMEAVLREKINVIGERYIAAKRSANEFEAQYKKLQQEFENSNAELVKNKKESAVQVATVLTELTPLLKEFRLRTDEAKFNEYFSTGRGDVFSIADKAAATAWAKETNPAWLNEVLNEDLVLGHIKNLAKNKMPLPEWATSKDEIKPKISTKI
ncbi:MAG: hypothetical protein ABL984_06925 [Pyrinomonadaceae bacterium]